MDRATLSSELHRIEPTETTKAAIDGGGALVGVRLGHVLLGQAFQFRLLRLLRNRRRSSGRARRLDRIALQVEPIVARDVRSVLRIAGLLPLDTATAREQAPSATDALLVRHGKLTKRRLAAKQLGQFTLIVLRELNERLGVLGRIERAITGDAILLRRVGDELEQTGSAALVVDDAGVVVALGLGHLVRIFTQVVRRVRVDDLLHLLRGRDRRGASVRTPRTAVDAAVSFKVAVGVPVSLPRLTAQVLGASPLILAILRPISHLVPSLKAGNKLL